MKSVIIYLANGIHKWPENIDIELKILMLLILMGLVL